MCRNNMMKKTIIRAIGILLIILGTFKAYTCLRVVAVYVPIAFEHGLAALGASAVLLNLIMAIIGMAKVAGGLGLLWLKQWAKWTAAAATILHAIILICFGIPIWIQMANGTFQNTAGIPLWKDYVTIAVNTVIAVTLLAYMKNENAQSGKGE